MKNNILKSENKGLQRDMLDLRLQANLERAEIKLLQQKVEELEREKEEKKGRAIAEFLNTLKEHQEAASASITVSCSDEQDDLLAANSACDSQPALCLILFSDV